MSAARRFTSRLTVSVIAAVSSGAAFAFEAGAPPATTGSFGETDCTACHFDNTINAAGGKLAISGVPDIFVPGQRYALTILLDHPQLVAGGFQLSARTNDGKPAGEFTVTGNDVTTITLPTTGVTYVQHSRPRFKDDDGVRWIVTWQAPDEDVAVIINAVANAANYDASPFGDHIFTTSASTAASEETTDASTEECDHDAKD